MKSSILIFALAISSVSAWSCSKSSTSMAEDKPAAAPAVAYTAPAAISNATAAPMSETPAPAAINTPKPVPIVIAPVTSRTEILVVAEAPAANTALAPDPRLDVSTALPEAVRLLIAKDYLGYLKEFTPPSQADNMGMTVDQLAEKLVQSPQTSDSLARLLAILLAVKDQKPTQDPTGTIVTFTLNPPIDDQKEIDFVKENGLWYIKN